MNSFQNYFSSADWKFHLRHSIDWDAILPLYFPQFPTPEGYQNKEELLDFFEQLLESTGKWAAESLAQRAVELDATGGGTLADGKVTLSAPLLTTYQEARSLDLFGLCIDPRHGGLGLPVGLGMLVFEQIGRACVSTSNQIGFFGSMADMVERFCPKWIQDKYVPLIAKGELSGSMCLTEPHAGSDVGSIRTTAKKADDGTYRLTGTKMFITNGGSAFSLILARLPGAPAGLDGISLFFAEQFVGEGSTRKLNYRAMTIEEKMGLKGSVTCEMVYEDTVAHLIGEPNEGFTIMLHLMNEARISVGLQGLGLMEAALDYANRYASEREQFGKLLKDLPLYRRNLQDLETERNAFRALMIDTVSSFDIFQRLHLKKQHGGEWSEEDTALFQAAKRITRRRTPLVKYYGAEAAATVTQKAIQAFGGYGFMKEYQVERLHRDSFGALLYEGTSQIQALMAMKDFVKGLMGNPKKFLQSLVASHPITSLAGGFASECHRNMTGLKYEFRKNVAGLLVQCFRPETSTSEKSFVETLTQLNRVFKKEYWQETHRFDRLMVHAETLCQAMSYLETLAVLSRQATRHPERSDLYFRYRALVYPRLQAIYADWQNPRST